LASGDIVRRATKKLHDPHHWQKVIKQFEVMQNILYTSKTKLNNEKKILKKIANDLKEIKKHAVKKKFTCAK